MRPLRPLLALGSLLALTAAAPVANHSAPPAAPVRNVVDTHWGVPIDDPYRDLENLADPAVQTWMKGQADHAAAALGQIAMRSALLARVKELDAGRPYRVSSVRRLAGGQLFYLKQRADENLAKLYVRSQGRERLLLDPSKLASGDGGHVSIDFYVPSPDGRRVVYGLAASGSEQSVLHVLDVASGKPLPDRIDRIENAYTDPQWLPDGSGFIYSRRRKLAPGTPETEVYKLSRSFLHTLGTNPDRDRPVFGKNLWANVRMSDVDFPSVVLTTGSSWAIGYIKHGDSNPVTLYAAPLERLAAGSAATPSPWIRVCDVPDSVTDFAVHGDAIDLVTARFAPRFRVVRTSLARPDLARAQVLVPPGELVVDGVSGAKDALYVQFREAAAGRVGRIAHEPGATLEWLTLPESFPSGRITSSSSDVAGVLVETAAWTRAGLTYAYDPAKRSFEDTRLNPTGRYDAVPGFTSLEVEVRSHDGVMVPLSIVFKRGLALDGSNPAYLTGYGSYGISRNVVFNPTLLAWLERGGVYAVAHVRGGGEKGDEWHVAGQKGTKPNTWKDFIACAEYLIAQRYTSPDRLAAQGGSAGGITVGRAITERPDLFDVALIDVGALDAVRMELTTNGVPNIQEFGTVTKEDEFRALLEMSAYHHVKDGVKYPAVMLTTGINDPRVEPWMSAKMAARLQSATASGKPVLLRVDYHAGHGVGSTKQQALALAADRYAFALWQMGLVKPAP